MNPETLNAYSDDVRSRDSYELSLGDALDVKVSILLAAITFLAALSGGIIAYSGLPVFFKWLQLGSLAALSAAGVLSLWELWPADYSFPHTPKQWAEWIAKLERHYAGKDDAATLVYRKYVDGVVAMAQERFEANRKINIKKSRLMKKCFLLVATSLGVNLATLWWLAIWHTKVIPWLC